ncbi:mannitol dehydrogenase family protein [Parahaliea maris]|uniref:Mannitol dehydrogenase family protein n=1 Tax=Parahaliea maris TaxID=2716870 RepID=A0A5C8ZRY3_9GAMM|nr:mannitol dehydrogenase family protein [Parahaliea maris]TXS90267.1 mannitol dehydrogenase family protein [Parahaliea maris]
MNRLSHGQLGQLYVPTPRYDRALVKAGMVHIGIGAFHRAHQADYTDKVMNRDGGDWGIIGSSLRSPRVRDLLQPQDGLYSLVGTDGEHQDIRVVGAVLKVLVATEDPQALIAALADPAIKVATLTITEKGYCHDPATGTLNRAHPDIAHDLEHYAREPRSAIGFLAAALIHRQALGAPITLLSCDNLSHNGRLLARVLKAFIAEVRPDVTPWVDDHVTFPCSMVDRIVPAVSAADLEYLSTRLGVRDEGAVFTERFCQWVIEDSFACERPRWENAGALLVDDVAPFEEMKLRLLNGSHSLIAYLGVLAGFTYVHEVMGNPDFARLVRSYMDSVTGTLSVPPGFDVERYKARLCERFANASLRHRTLQIAADGSQKIPQRWLPPLRQIIDQRGNTNFIALALAGWLRFLQGQQDNGTPIAVDDPLLDSLRKRMTGERTPGAAILGYEPVFGDLAAQYPDFVTVVEKIYSSLQEDGVMHFLSSNSGSTLMA